MVRQLIVLFVKSASLSLIVSKDFLLLLLRINGLAIILILLTMQHSNIRICGHKRISAISNSISSLFKNYNPHMERRKTSADTRYNANQD